MERWRRVPALERPGAGRVCSVVLSHLPRLDTLWLRDIHRIRRKKLVLFSQNHHKFSSNVAVVAVLSFLINAH